MPVTPKLLLIDGHSLAFRAYYAFAKGRDGGLRTSTGVPTSVCYGFLKTLFETVEAEQPTSLAIAFDLGGKTFRHEADPRYKANRPETPADFFPDLDNLQEVLKAMDLPIVVSPGYEADDVIGTLTRKALQQDWQVRVLSGDRDLFQLVDDRERVKILYMSTVFGKAAPPPKAFGIKEIKTKLGVLPSQVVDFKALCGDSSDNLSGIRGIGAKIAADLISTYGSLEKVYENVSDVKGPALRAKLIEGKDLACHTQWMTQIHLDTPLPLALEDCKLKPFDPDAVNPLIEKLEFKTFKQKLERFRKFLAGEPIEPIKTSKTASSKTQSQDNVEDGDTSFFSAEETDAATLIERVNSQLKITVPPKKRVNSQPRIIDTPEKLTALITLLESCTDPTMPVAWDTETTSKKPRDAELVGIGCCWMDTPDGMAYIPVGHHTGQNLDRAQVLEALRPILESDRYPKVLQNAKYDRLVFRFQGIQLAGVVFDTMLASYVIDPEQSHGLKKLSENYLNLLADSFEQLVPKGQTIADCDIAAAAKYCGDDVYITYRLVPILTELLQESPRLMELFQTVELPLEPVLADMESIGVRIDQAYLEEFAVSLETDLQSIEQRAYELVGEQLNLGSPTQVSKLLFDQLGLDTKKSKKTKTGYSTDAATLEKLQGDHPVIDEIIEYRTLSKLKSTYVDKLPTLVRLDTQRVHTDYNQAVTATGRLSSSEPNLQNIPIRTAFSRQIRKAFLPKEGWLLVGADYSQIELRILAHLSQEETLLDAYRNHQDVHSLTAKLLLEKDEISSEERRLGKIINFGVIYGMGAQRFAREAGVKTSEAKSFIERFNQRYAKVFAYLQQMEREAIAKGYVETIAGRRRYFNFSSDILKRLRGTDPNSIDLDQLKLRDQYDAQLLRAAANAPIQGSSADIIKLAMIHLHEQLKPYDANLLLQVHDELVFEVHPDAWPELQTHIKTTMEQAVQLTVPLVVEIHAGQNWMETK